MRLNWIELRAFGPFTRERVDLPLGKPDFRVIYGPNEAGKSSLLRAITDLLFGIPERTADAFLHPMGDLRLAGEVLAGGRPPLAFCRRKGRQSTLRSPDESAVVKESQLAECLFGADRPGFEREYGLTLGQLQLAAASMLSASGAELFAEIGGLKDAREVLRRIEEEAAAIFAPKARNAQLNAALTRFKEASAAERVIPGPRIAALRDSASAAVRQKRAADGRLCELELERRRLERIKANAPDLAQLAELEPESERVRSAPDLAPQASADRVKAETERASAERDCSVLEEEIARLEQELAALPRPGAILEHGAAIAALAPQLGVYRKQQADLGTRRAERQRTEAEAEAIWRHLAPDLAPEGAAAQRPNRARSLRLLGLVQRRAALIAEGKACDLAATQAEHGLRDREAALRAHPPAADAAPLASAIEQAREGASEDSGEKARHEARASRSKAEAAAALLPGWTGNLAALQALAPPLPETRERLRQAWETAEQALRKAKAECEHAEKAQQHAERERDGHPLPAGAASREDLDQARQRRDQIWRQVRAGDGPPPDALAEEYEELVRAADALADQRFTQAEAVGKAEMLAGAAEQAAIQAGQRAAAATVAEWEFAAARKAWDADWPDVPAGLPLPPAEMEAWLARRADALEPLAAAETKGAEAEETRRSVAHRIGDLSVWLEKTGAPPAAEGESLAVLLRRAEGHRQQLEKAAGARCEAEAALRRGKEGRDEAEQVRQKLNRETQDWEREWTAAIAGLAWAQGLDPDSMHQAMADMEEVGKKLDDAATLRHRIEAMEEFDKAFASRVRDLCQAAAPELASLAADLAAEKLAQSLNAARRDSDQRERLTEELEAKRSAWQAAVSKREAADAELRRLCVQANCQDAAELPRIEAEAAHKRQLRAQIEQIRRSLQQRNQETLDAVRAEATPYSADQITVRLEELGRERETEKGRQEDAIRTRAEAEQELSRLEASEAAAEAAQRAAGSLTEIKSAGEQYVRLRIAQSVAQAAIKKYREEHEAPLLQRAQPIFAAITRGEFAALLADLDEGGKPRLLARRRGGGQVPWTGLSEGTRDQLALALRMAAVEMACERQPMPLILDDVLVNFDDQRAAAGLEQLAKLGGKTQVLLFTHHGRIRDLAQQQSLAVTEIGAGTPGGGGAGVGAGRASRPLRIGTAPAARPVGALRRRRRQRRRQRL